MLFLARFEMPWEASTCIIVSNIILLSAFSSSSFSLSSISCSFTSPCASVWTAVFEKHQHLLYLSVCKHRCDTSANYCQYDSHTIAARLCIENIPFTPDLLIGGILLRNNIPQRGCRVNSRINFRQLQMLSSIASGHFFSFCCFQGPPCLLR